MSKFIYLHSQKLRNIFLVGITCRNYAHINFVFGFPVAAARNSSPARRPSESLCARQPCSETTTCGRSRFVCENLFCTVLLLFIYLFIYLFICTLFWFCIFYFIYLFIYLFFCRNLPRKAKQLWTLFSRFVFVLSVRSVFTFKITNPLVLETST